MLSVVYNSQSNFIFLYIIESHHFYWCTVHFNYFNIIIYNNNNIVQYFMIYVIFNMYVIYHASVVASTCQQFHSRLNLEPSGRRATGESIVKKSTTADRTTFTATVGIWTKIVDFLAIVEQIIFTPPTLFTLIL